MNEKILRERIKLELAKGEESFKAAKILFDAGLFGGSVSDSYYAMFHCVIAALITATDEPSTHKGAVLLFNQHFIQTKVFEERFGVMLGKAKEAREDSDYDVTVKFTKDEAGKRIEEAETFLERIKKYLKEKDLL